MALDKIMENQIKALNLNELEELFNLVSSLLIVPTYPSDFNVEIKEKKFFKVKFAQDAIKIISLNTAKDMTDKDINVRIVEKFLTKGHHL